MSKLHFKAPALIVEALLIFSILSQALARAEQPNLQLKLDTKNKNQGFQWNLKTTAALPCKSNPKLYCVEVSGFFQMKNTTLTLNTKAMKIEPNGEFTIKVPLRSKNTKIKVSFVTKNSTTPGQDLTILYQDWGRHPASDDSNTDALEAENQTLPLSEGRTLNSLYKSFAEVAVGYNSMSYSQTGNSNLSQGAIDGQIDIDLALSSHFELTTEGRYTLYNSSSNIPSKLLTGAFHIGWTPWVRKTAKFTFFTGINVSEFTNSSSVEGYSQCYFLNSGVEYSTFTSSKASLEIFGQFSTLGHWFSSSQRQLSLGLKRLYYLKNNHAWSLGAEWYSFVVMPDTDTTIQLSSLLFSLGYRY